MVGLVALPVAAGAGFAALALLLLAVEHAQGPREEQSRGQTFPPAFASSGEDISRAGVATVEVRTGDGFLRDHCRDACDDISLELSPTASVRALDAKGDCVACRGTTWFQRRFGHIQMWRLGGRDSIAVSLKPYE